MKELSSQAIQRYKDMYPPGTGIFVDNMPEDPRPIASGTKGTMSHGRSLTAQITMSPNHEKECSLSDFLEVNVPEKYCLSPKQIQKLLHSESQDVKDAGSTLPMG